ncbi:hypothetical protein B5807_08387 [Epicoccum nigrum]|uniref:BTB domain-containing protein n=1 Tax=Epicoccum nigrum TaxID=105696 RepID=A0A1Y2LSV5_EPING|nr:hypothetical protein B5807_08387 [Epicoccum nigrum]
MARPSGSDWIVSEAKRMKFDDLVHVEVGTGENSKAYAIYSSTLTTRSLFFRKALSGPWKEIEERVVHLPEDDVRAFDLYLHYIYNKEFTCSPSDDQYGEEERGTLVRLYVLCEKLQDPKSKNCIIKALSGSIYKIRSNGNWNILESAVVEILYKGTFKGSPVRRMLFDIFAQGVPSNFATADWTNKYPEEFLQDLAVSLMTTFDLDVRRAAPLPREGKVVAYLEKEEQVE